MKKGLPRIDDFDSGIFFGENENAALAGARIIVNPEPCVSGYGFDSRTDIAPVGPTGAL